jgi:hypothetical protein
MKWAVLLASVCVFFGAFSITGTVSAQGDVESVIETASQVPLDELEAFENRLAGGIVQCGTNIEISTTREEGKICHIGECTLCDAQVSASNLLSAIIFASIIFAGVLFIYAGVLFLFFPVNPANISTAFVIIRRTTVGLAIVLVSWLAVDTAMRHLFVDSKASNFFSQYGPWNNFLCAGQEGPSVRCYDVIEALTLYGETRELDRNCSAVGGNCRSNCRMRGGANATRLQEYTEGICEQEGFVCCVATGWRHPEVINVEETVGCGKVLDAASEMYSSGCKYDQTNRNGCTGDPGYTDCSDFAYHAYQKAGCDTSFGNLTATMVESGEQISTSDRSGLQAGDVVVYRYTNSKGKGIGHASICMEAGCRTFISARGKKDGIQKGFSADYVFDNADGVWAKDSYFVENGGLHVLRASKYCREASAGVSC